MPVKEQPVITSMDIPRALLFQFQGRQRFTHKDSRCITYMISGVCRPWILCGSHIPAATLLNQMAEQQLINIKFHICRCSVAIMRWSDNHFPLFCIKTRPHLLPVSHPSPVSLPPMATLDFLLQYSNKTVLGTS